MNRAFDVFNRTLLLKRFYDVGVRGSLLDMLASFYEARYQKVKVGLKESQVREPLRPSRFSDYAVVIFAFDK